LSTPRTNMSGRAATRAILPAAITAKLSPRLAATASIVTGATAVPRNPEKVWIEKARLTRAGAVVGNCYHAWNKLVDQPWTILSIGLCEWAHEY
jgi:hypothetical protein